MYPDLGDSEVGKKVVLGGGFKGVARGFFRLGGACKTFIAGST